MKLRAWTEDLRLIHPFTISRGSRSVVRTAIVEVAAEGAAGFGEASPSAYYGHTPEGVLASLEKVRPLLEGSDPSEPLALIPLLEQELRGDLAALSALDMALHDLAGKKQGLPLRRLLRLPDRDLPVSSYTIGLDEIPRMVEKAREAEGFPILKVKLGTGDDLGILRALRAASTAVFRVDANCAWTAAETVEKSRALKDLGVEFIEQPLPPERLPEMQEVRRCSALPIYADESAVTAADVPALADRFDGIVIKLVKCGGILGALRMVDAARARGLKVMLGCMIESSLAITAAAQLGSLADHLDLDGSILIANDPFEGASNALGRIRLPEESGLGVKPRG